MSEARDDISCVTATKPATQADEAGRLRSGEDMAPSHGRDFHGAAFCVDRRGRLAWASSQANQALRDLHHLAPGRPDRLRPLSVRALWRDVPADRRLRHLAPATLGATGVARMTADRRRLIVELWRIDASQVQVDPLWSVLLTKLAHST